MTIDTTKLIDSAVKLDPRLTKLIFFGFLPLALSVYLWSFLADAQIPFWSVPLLILIFGICMTAISHISPRQQNLLSWVVFMAFFVWLSVLIGQIITTNRFTPPLATSLCLVNPFQERCSFNYAGAAVTQKAAPGPGASLLLSPEDPLQPIKASFVTTPHHVARLAPLLVQDNLGPNDVYIQFAVLPREDIVALASALLGLGWNVQGADSGGERIAAADGLMEVRYFFADDLPRAALLAQAVSANRPGNPGVGLNDLSATDLATKVSPGHFEIWMSK